MKKVYDFLEKDIELTNRDTIVVGCSGGPDSMALMNILMDIRKKKNLLLICAHVNHNVRKESREEERFMQEYCANNGIVFESMTIEAYGDDNFHNEARKIRYRFFEEVVSKYQAKYLMTAHHGDDLIETILMRIVRGSTLKGYAGFERIIKNEKYTLIRPLIFVTKKEIKKYNDKNNVPYVVDKSNFKGKYTRNRYRKDILPFLKREDELVHNKFLKFSDTLIEYSNYIDNIIQKEIRRVYVDDYIKIPLFLTKEELIQKKIIFYILEQIYNDDLNQINTTHVLSIIKLMKSKRSSGSINLPGSYKVIKEYDVLRIKQEVDYIGSYEIEIDKFVELPRGRTIQVVDFEEKNDNNVCRLLSSEIVLPLYVRTRKLGDKISLKKINGKQKLKQIFIDKKVPVSLRDDWPVVVDSNDNILWIPGIKKSKFSKHKNESYDIILKCNQ
ncbi:MAG: tRNA lysidine(34) synthetase TilS [Bacilli bacterium]|nr:tRNA lysidine(34) synthetase TilS [Bacilli bacterium]